MLNNFKDNLKVTKFADFTSQKYIKVEKKSEVGNKFNFSEVKYDLQDRLFFPGEGKSFSGGGGKTYFLNKINKKYTIFLKKFLKHFQPARRGVQEPPWPLSPDPNGSRFKR